MFADAKDVQTHLVGERNLFQQMMHALRGVRATPVTGSGMDAAKLSTPSCNGDSFLLPPLDALRSQSIQRGAG
jgi:hypothetical protein